MSEATRYTIFFVLSFVTFTAWGMITHDLRGTVWYWAAGVLLAMPSLGSLANSARQGLQTYPYKLIFPALMICLIVRYLFWLLHHK